MSRFCILLCLIWIFSSCARTPSQPPDTEADTTLGVIQDEQKMEAEEVLDHLEQMRSEERRRNLERQITDPLFETPQTGET